MRFEGIAKTNTTHTCGQKCELKDMFEGIAKTNTTHTPFCGAGKQEGLRVLLKQILPTQCVQCFVAALRLRVLLKQILPTRLIQEMDLFQSLRVLLKQILPTQ